MKVLVTGAEGQVGSELLRLADDDFEVVGFDRYGLDITDAAGIEQRLEECAPDLLVNCAAYTAVDRAEDEPEAAHRVNAEGVGLLGRACRDCGVGIVHLSTDYVFDGAKDAPYVEEDAPNPLSVYGASKLRGEDFLRKATDRHLILRVSWVFGRVGRSFVDTILKLACERDEVSVVHDQIGTPTPAEAIARTIKQLARAVVVRDSLWDTYHFCANPSVSWFAFAETIILLAAEVGLLRTKSSLKPIPASEWPSKATRPMNSTLDMAKLAGALGTLCPDWESYLREFLMTKKEVSLLGQRERVGPERES